MLTFHALGLALVPTLAGCMPSAGWGTDVTATSLDDDQWKVNVVITKYQNTEDAEKEIVASPTLICRSGESASMLISGGSQWVEVKTTADPVTEAMVFDVMVREFGQLRSQTTLKIQPDQDASTISAMAGAPESN